MMLCIFLRRVNYKNTINIIVKRNKTYLSNHEWLSEKNNIYKIGIDNYAKKQLDEIVYIDFNIDKEEIISKDHELVFIESVKAVETICAPFDCKIIDINSNLQTNLDDINNNPECEDRSWILKLSKIF